MSSKEDPAPRKKIQNEAEGQRKDVNVENGDLGAWEYFIHTYDHGATMDDSENGAAIASQTRDTQEKKVTHSTTTLPKQEHSDIGIAHHSFHPMSIPSGAFMNGSSATNDHWRYHPQSQFGNYATHSTPSFASDSVVTDLSSMINSQRSWSFPLLTNQTMHHFCRAEETTSLRPLYEQVLESINEAALQQQHERMPLIYDHSLAGNVSLSRTNLERYHLAISQHPDGESILSDAAINPNRISVNSGALRYEINDANAQGSDFVSSPACDDYSLEAPKANISDIQIPVFAQEIVPPYMEHRNPRLLLKPLTPYNYYYRDERENIVRHITNEEDTFPPPVSDFSQSKMHSLLYHHWYVDPVKQKRIHRKSHGKVSFESLSKAISKRWHDLPLEGRAFYRNVSLADNAYFHHHTRRMQEQHMPSLSLTSPAAAEERSGKDDYANE